MEVLIRFSLNNDTDNSLRPKLRRALVDNGFVASRTRTATYTAVDISADRLATALSSFWSNVAGYNGGASVDHFWMYSDHEEPGLDSEIVQNQ